MISTKNLQLGIGMLQLVIGPTRPYDHITLDQAILLELRVRLFGADLAAQAALAGISELLGEGETDVASGLGAEPRSGKWIAIACVAYRQSRVGQAAILPGALARGFVALLRSKDIEIAAPGFFDQIL